jgi:hypothetical protein
VIFSRPELMGAFNINQFALDYCNAAGLSPATHLMSVEDRAKIAGMGPSPQDVMAGGKPNGGAQGGNLDQTMRTILENAQGVQ